MGRYLPLDYLEDRSYEEWQFYAKTKHIMYLREKLVTKPDPVTFYGWENCCLLNCASTLECLCAHVFLNIFYDLCFWFSYVKAAVGQACSPLPATFYSWFVFEFQIFQGKTWLRIEEEWSTFN